MHLHWLLEASVSQHGCSVDRDVGSQEELEDVQLHEGHRDQHGVADAAVNLVLPQGVGQDEDSPAHHPHAAVGPGLDIEVPAYTRIKLHA